MASTIRYSILFASIMGLLSTTGYGGVTVNPRGFKVPMGEMKEEPPAGEEPEAGIGRRNIPVEGYAGSARFVYGDVEEMGNGEIAGYIYRPGLGRTYVYGESVPSQGMIVAYDQKGTRYLLKQSGRGGRR